MGKWGLGLLDVVLGGRIKGGVVGREQLSCVYACYSHGAISATRCGFKDTRYLFAHSSLCTCS